MKEILSFFTVETIVCLLLVPLDVFLLIKSATTDKRNERIYTVLSETVLFIMLVLIIKYLKDII